MIDKLKIQKAFKWQLLNISIQAILQIAFIMISARVLPQEIHGAFAILYAFVFVMAISSDVGVSTALIQRKDINLKHTSIAFYSSLCISLVLFLFVFLFSKYISVFYDQKIKVQDIRWASLIFIFMAIGKVSESFLIKNFRFKEIFISKSLSYFIGSIIVMYFLAINGFGLYALIIGFITTQSLNSILFFLWTRHSLLLRFGKKEFKDLYYFGSSFTLLRIVNYLSSQIDKLLMGKYLPLDTLSLYDKGQYIAKMPPKYIGNTIDSILFSAFSKIEDIEIKKNYLEKIVALIFGVSCYFAIVIFFNSSIIVKSILGPDWIDSAPFLRILAISIPAIILARIGDIVVRSENKMFRSLPIKIIFLIILLLSILVFRNASYLSLTAGIVVAYWIHALLMLFLSLSIVNANYLKMIKVIFVISAFTILVSLKYYLLSHYIQNDWLFLIINFFIDVILIAVIILIFKNDKNILGLINIFKRAIFITLKR